MPVISRAFKKTTGVAPHKYFSDLRAEEIERVTPMFMLQPSIVTTSGTAARIAGIR
jgi:hypothetical protein